MLLRSVVLAGMLAAWASSASSAVLDVAFMKITEFDFYLTSSTGARFDSSDKAIAADTNLVAGARDPIVTFFLSVPPVAQSGPVETDTTAAAAFAQIDTVAGTFNVDLSTWNMDWDSARCLENNPAFESCIDIPQGPGTIAKNTWNPVTQQFELEWSRQINRHPVQGGTGHWTLRGFAQPVPEPATPALLLAGLALASISALRRRVR